MQPDLRFCPKCDTEKSVSEFYVSSRRPDGRQLWCKKCQIESATLWNRLNREKFNENGRNFREANLEKRRAKDRRWYAVNKEKVRAYKAANLDRTKLYRQKAYCTVGARLNRSISTSICHSLSGNKNGRHWESLVGFTLEQLKQHIEKHFLAGMGWENRNTWHIDHKIPVAVFNFTKPEDIDFKRCWSLKNLRPLWSKENISKGAKIERPFQPSLAISISGRNPGVNNATPAQ